MTAALLEAKNLRISYRSPQGPVSLVHGIGLQIDAGQTVALVGESGSGKTLTGRAIMGMLSPRTMTVEADLLTLHGAPIVQRDRGRLTPDVAMIFQNPFTSLNPTLTIGQFLREVIRRRHGLSGKAARSRALELMESVRIPLAAQKLDSYPHQLSGGQQQRVVIAVALALEPALLIADEPTTALDVTVQAGIIDLLATLQQERGMGLLFISHDLSLVSDIASDVVVLYQGEVVETGDRTLMTGSATHPYTKALLAASPSVHHRKPSLSTGAMAWIDGLEATTDA